jgi:hypothetical protein
MGPPWPPFGHHKGISHVQNGEPNINYFQMEVAMQHAKFKVDPRLATLLGQDYSTTEKALKELIDNAWDADAEIVQVILPEPLTDAPIVIQDDGNGMARQELEHHYLNIASDRRVRAGGRTAKKRRVIKGKKGIGKFAGLMCASGMSVTTKARGEQISFSLSVEDLNTATGIEHLELPLNVAPCASDEHGTWVTLVHLRQGLRYPSAERLRQELIMEYGREQDFTIIINGKALDIDDLDGEFTEIPETLTHSGKVILRFTISTKKSGLRRPGISLMVDGKAVGKPGFFGLEQSDEVPPRLLKKLYGEIEADGIMEYVTAGWDSVIENSESYVEITTFVQRHLLDAFRATHGMEMRLAHARLKKAVDGRLQKLPEHKREFADRAIKKVLKKYYDEPAHKVQALAYVVLEAVERSEYRLIMEHLAEAKRGDVSNLAEALERFGLADMAVLVDQAKARLQYLDDLEQLIRDKSCLEVTVHRAIEVNLWILGAAFTVFSSNITLKRQVEQLLNKQYEGREPSTRPDLLLNESLTGDLLLIEFKRPSHGLTYEDYQQATRYRHHLGEYTAKSINVLVIGGKVNDFPTKEREPNVNHLLFTDIISTARRQIEWQLQRTPEFQRGLSL